MTTPNKNGTTSQDKIEISVNLDTFLIGDLRALDMAEDKSPKILVNLLDRVVEGGARHLPLRYIHHIGKQLRDEMAALTDETDEEDVIELPAGVTVDADRLTIGDLELLETEGGDRSADDIIALLDRVVIGEDIENLSIKYLAPINARLKSGMKSMGDLGN